MIRPASLPALFVTAAAAIGSIAAFARWNKAAQMAKAISRRSTGNRHDRSVAGAGAPSDAVSEAAPNGLPAKFQAPPIGCAAIVDFGGFLEVGTRKIVIDWHTLQFDEIGAQEGMVADRDQISSAPEHKDSHELVAIVTAIGAALGTSTIAGMASQVPAGALVDAVRSKMRGSGGR
jgi:hypothetical protein